MSEKRSTDSGRKNKGIRLNYLNLLLAILGLVLAALMVYSTNQTTDSVAGIVEVTDTYLNNQQAGGMLSDVAPALGQQALAFVQSGEPGPANAYNGQWNALRTQMDLYVFSKDNESEADSAYREAMNIFSAQNAADVRAMRLVADTLPAPLFSALPTFLQEAELSEEDKALSPEEKKQTALALLTSEEYAAYSKAIRTAVDNNHRLSSEEGKKRAAEASARVSRIVSEEKQIVFLVLVLAAVAFLVNEFLLQSHIRKSVSNLDRREPIPEKGCYEMRHLAEVYNDVLKDNQEKTAKLSYTATHDALTGLINRADFDRLFHIVETEQIGLVVADVDHFKQYNDEFGHDVGDRVLQMASAVLKHHFRAEDHVCRIGGDEFCVIMPGLCHADGVKVVERIEAINRELAEAGSDLPPITISAGVAFWNRPNPKGSIFKDADTALMDLKKTRDGCCAVYRG